MHIRMRMRISRIMDHVFDRHMVDRRCSGIDHVMGEKFYSLGWSSTNDGQLPDLQLPDPTIIELALTSIAQGAQPMARTLRRVGGAHRAPSGPRCVRRLRCRCVAAPDITIL